MDEILDEVPDRAMAVFAHPADAEIACGATLARWASAGCAITMIVCTQGDKGSHEPSADPKRIAATRTNEVEAAAEVLGLAGFEVLDHLDGDVSNSTDLRRTLVQRIRAFRPSVVFGHDPTAVFIGSTYVNHRDHREVGFALCDAVAPAAGSPLYFPDAGDPHRVGVLLLSGTQQTDVWSEVTGHLDAKVAALRCHESQVNGNEDGLDAVVRQRAEEGQQRTGLAATEAFRRIRLD